MKKVLFISIFIFLAASPLAAQKRWFVGGTATISYTEQFTCSLEPQLGYEFTDRFAIGSGVGFSSVVADGVSGILGLVEPYVRITAWHNNFVYLDFKPTAAFGFDHSLELLQVGIRPSLRFRMNEHWDASADIGLFGASFLYDEWYPALGITGGSAGIWLTYRF